MLGEFTGDVWQVRRAIKAVNEEMVELRRVEKPPEKTFIGRIARGFDFLGYWFSLVGLSIARKTVERMVEKVSRLYEQGADEIRIETYLKRWGQWVRSGGDGVLVVSEGSPLLSLSTLSRFLSVAVVR